MTTVIVERYVQVCGRCGITSDYSPSTHFGQCNPGGGVEPHLICHPCLEKEAIELENKRLAESPVERDLMSRGYAKCRGVPLGIIPEVIEFHEGEECCDVVDFEDPRANTFHLVKSGQTLQSYSSLGLAFSAYLEEKQRLVEIRNSIARQWKAQNRHNNPYGAVVMDRACTAIGWIPDLNSPEAWHSGRIAVCNDGEHYVAEGGMFDQFASTWKLIVKNGEWLV